MPTLPSNAADLTLTQIAEHGLDFINSQVAAHVFANTAMKNIYQGEIEKGGRGSTQEFSSNTTGSSITVVRPLPLPIKARQLGAAINGGNFSAYDYQPSSDAYDLKIITVIDDIVDIPNVSLDMIPVGIAQMYIKNISDKVVLNINALKIAASLYTSLSAEQADSTSAYVTAHVNGVSYLKELTKAYTSLDKGDKGNGVSMFPQDDRIGLISVDNYAEIISANGVFAVGGANYGYDILRKGTVDAQSQQQKLNDGYVGDMFGIPFHLVSPLVFETACEYLGFADGTFDGVLAMIKSAHGNLFGLAAGSSIKTIDSPKGQGVRLQPLYRMGAACVMPKSVSLYVDTGFVNPYDLKALLTATSISFGYVAPASRPVLAPTVTAVASEKLKVVCNGAEEALFVVSTTAITTVGGFVTAFVAAAAGDKGNILKAAFNTDVQTTATAADVVYVLCVAADGTLSEIKSATILD